MTATVTSGERVVEVGRSASRGGWRAPVAGVARLVASLAAGVALLMAFAPVDAWWAAPLGVAGLAVVVHGRRPLVGWLLGFCCGLAFFVPLLDWTNLYTGSLPWLLLSVSQAVFVGLLGAAGAWCSPVVARWPVALAPVTGLLWTMQEAVRDRAPFGGFPWGRLAFSQGDSPLLALAAFGGAPLVSFAVALVGGLLAVAVLALVRPWVGDAGDRGPGRVLVPVAVAAAVGLVAVGGLVPVAVPDGPAVTVAIVQGNVPRLGLDFNAQRRAVLDNHVNGTLRLARQVAEGSVARPDLVVWPENSSDIDPLVHADAAARIDEAAAAIGVPILVGAVLEHGDKGLNTGLVWVPGRGVTQRYTKRHPVPFAEYVPMRRIARMVTDKVDLVRVEFEAGRGPGVLTMGPARVGDVICFEVAYDGLVRDLARGGAELLAVQTNNANFDVPEARQQMAMVRLRAVEHGRPALMASTVGISGFVGADGRVLQSTGFFTAEVLVERVRLGRRSTVATVVGAWPEYVLVGFGVGLFGAAGWLRRRGAARRSAG